MDTSASRKYIIGPVCVGYCHADYGFGEAQFTSNGVMNPTHTKTSLLWIFKGFRKVFSYLVAIFEIQKETE